MINYIKSYRGNGRAVRRDQTPDQHFAVKIKKAIREDKKRHAGTSHARNLLMTGTQWPKISEAMRQSRTETYPFHMVVSLTRTEYEWEDPAVIAARAEMNVFRGGSSIEQYFPSKEQDLSHLKNMQVIEERKMWGQKTNDAAIAFFEGMLGATRVKTDAYSYLRPGAKRLTFDMGRYEATVDISVTHKGED